MKKCFIIFALPFLMAGCANQPAEMLPSLPIDFSNPPSSTEPSSVSESEVSTEVSSSEKEPTYQYVKLDKENCGLSSDDSTSAIQLSLSSLIDSSVTYELEIGVPCYLHSKFHEFVMKPGSYIKSLSQYTVDRLIIDFYGAKGTNFEVYSTADGTGSAIEYHESYNEPEDSDGGAVYEYPINGTEWSIRNNTDVYKPGIYSVIVVFLK